MSHIKNIPGKDVANSATNPNDTTLISFEIPGDEIVAGLGMPITMRLCRKIIKDYHDAQMKIYDALGRLSPSPEVNSVRAGVSPESEIVSGVYGRDTLMHILEQEGCEGIRYINCVYGGEKSIVLLGVDKDGVPIGGMDKFLTDTPSKNVVLYEVKGMPKTRAEINEKIPSNPLESDVTNIILKTIL